MASSSNNVTVTDSATNTTIADPSAVGPVAVALNPVSLFPPVLGVPEHYLIITCSDPFVGFE